MMGCLELDQLCLHAPAVARYGLPMTNPKVHIIQGTTDNPEVAREWKYDGEVLRVTFASRDWVEFGVNADNPRHEWVLAQRYTNYGGRCVSTTTAPLEGVPTFDSSQGVDAAYAQRAVARQAMLELLVEAGLLGSAACVPSGRTISDGRHLLACGIPENPAGYCCEHTPLELHTQPACEVAI